uniref:Uncharacterized protein n=1 Tax=Timema cristinae TaxID=61476 RepID=A0A7R9H6T2_TIMCR|nr:unnamed protein product [Timema cristinae]
MVIWVIVSTVEAAPLIKIHCVLPIYFVCTLTLIFLSYMCKPDTMTTNGGPVDDHEQKTTSEPIDKEFTYHKLKTTGLRVSFTHRMVSTSKDQYIRLRSTCADISTSTGEITRSSHPPPP